MAITIKRKRIGNLVLPPVCVDDYNRRCKHNGETCNCMVYAGNPEQPMNFEVA